MKSTCSKTTTPSFIWRNLNVSSKKTLPLINFNFLAQFSVRENLLVVAGTPETRELKDMMPDILKQVGPQQYQFLKTQLGSLGNDGKAAEEDDDDDVPQLVGNFEDAAKKWVWSLIRNGWVNIESIKSLTQSIELGNPGSRRIQLLLVPLCFPLLLPTDL